MTEGKIDKPPRRKVMIAPSRENYMGGILKGVRPPNKEVNRPKVPVELVALRSSLRGIKRYFEGDQIDPREIEKTCSGIVNLFNEAVRENPSSDFILAGEYSLYFHPNLAQPLEFEQKDDGYEIVAGQPEVKTAIKRLQDLAKEAGVNLCIGTVCEKEVIDGIPVYHNTAVIIDNSGKIIHLRRKITGSEAIMFLEEKYSSDFLHKSTEIQPHRYGEVLLIPGKDVFPQTGEQQIVAAAFLSALKTIKPIELSTRQGNIFTILVGICAERNEEVFLRQAGPCLANVIAFVVNEGDDHYTERSKAQFLGNSNKHFVVTDKIQEEWEGSFFAEAAVHLGALKPDGVWIASDSCDKGSAGVFPVYDPESIEETTFRSKWVVAKCRV